MSGRSGARPIPPATITTSRPTVVSTGQPRPSGPRSATSAPVPSAVSAAVAGPAARIVSSRPSGRIREIEIGGAANAGRSTMTNCPGRACSSAGSDVARRSVTVSTVSGTTEPTVAIACVAGSTRASGAGARPSAGDSGHGIGPFGAKTGAIAASSSRTSMPTGHQAMQRPQPTHPVEPNWSHQVENLCVSHWR